MNKILRTLLAVLLLTLLIPVSSAAELDHTDDKLSLTINAKSEDSCLSDVLFSLYKVAELDENGKLSVTDDFSGYSVEIQGDDEEHYRIVASTLEGYALQDQIVPCDSGSTDENGTVSFPSADIPLTKGLYLVLGQKNSDSEKYYEFTPFMITLPASDSNGELSEYNVAVAAKFTENDLPEDNKLSRRVLKVWDDSDSEALRPAEITVYLLKNGQVYKTESLTAENNWSCSWNDLDATASWRVTEKITENYNVTVSREGITYVVTNTFNGEPPEDTPPDEEPSLPQTGLLWWPVYTLTAAGLLFIIIGIIRRRCSDGK